MNPRVRQIVEEIEKLLAELKQLTGQGGVHPNDSGQDPPPPPR